MVDDFVWDPPGPGQWWLELDHWPAPITPLFAEVFPAAFDGNADAHTRYGVPYTPPRFETANGWYYYSGGTPAEFDADSFDALAAAALAERSWLRELDEWRHTDRPAALAADRALQAVDLSSLDDRGVADHLRACLDHFREVSSLHFGHFCYYAAVGLLVEAVEPYGISPAEVAGWLSGWSPASGAPAAAVRAIAEALRTAGVDHVATLDDIPAAGSEASVALDQYLDDFAWQILADDIAFPSVGERPETIVAAVQAALDGADRTAPAVDADEVLSRIPPDARESVATLLAEARDCYGVRDDDDHITFMWPLGLVRRAMLEAGRRAAAADRLEDPSHIFEARSAEAIGLVLGTDTSGPAAWAARAERRRRSAACNPPSPLGEAGPPSPPQEPGPNSARLKALSQRYWLAESPAAGELTGIGVGTATYRGTARVVKGALEALDRVQPGDVLVTTITSPAFNTVLAAAGALVVQSGGLMSHAALVARELGLPAVVGVSDVHDHVRDGDVVEVDPVAGAVRVIARSATAGA